MSALLSRPEQAVSSTSMARSFGSRLDQVSSGELPHLVIFRDNEPTAVLIGIEAFQAMQDELEDMRVERLAIERLGTLETTSTISMEEMERRFAIGAD